MKHFQCNLSSQNLLVRSFYRVPQTVYRNTVNIPPNPLLELNFLIFNRHQNFYVNKNYSLNELCSAQVVKKDNWKRDQDRNGGVWNATKTCVKHRAFQRRFFTKESSPLTARLAVTLWTPWKAQLRELKPKYYLANSKWHSNSKARYDSSHKDSDKLSD